MRDSGRRSLHLSSIHSNMQQHRALCELVLMEFRGRTQGCRIPTITTSSSNGSLPTTGAFWNAEYADALSPSLLKRLIKGEGGAAERQCRHWLHRSRVAAADELAVEVLLQAGDMAVKKDPQTAMSRAILLSHLFLLPSNNRTTGLYSGD